MLVLPSQTIGLCAQVGLSRAEADRSAWVFDRKGRRWEAAAAANRLFSELPRLRWLAPLYAVPPLRWSEDRFYRWFANHRGGFAWVGTTPACEQAGVGCEPEGGAHPQTDPLSG